MASNVNPILIFVRSHEIFQRAGAEIDESVAFFAMEPMAMAEGFPVAFRAGGVISFRSVVGAMEDERIGEAMRLEVMQGSIDRDGVAGKIEGFVDGRRRKGRSRGGENFNDC